MAKKPQINKAFVEKYLEENNGYPEKGYFEDKKDLQRFYKHLTDEQLQEWIDVEGLTYTPCPESEAINRMRMCMAILYYHFPKPPAKKKKSKYADYSLEDLVQMAIDNEVPVEPCDDDRILRMRTIMALRAAGYLE
jgi:hypothetical protein